MRIRISVLALLVPMFAARVFADPSPAHEAQRQKASQAYELGDWGTVIQTCSGILRDNQQDNIALHLRGSARIEHGLVSEDGGMIRAGIADARQAITVASKPEFNYYLPYLYGMTCLTTVEGQASHAEVAVGIATQLLEQKSITPEQKSNVQYQRGLAHAAAGKLAESINDYRASVIANPKNIASYMAMADAYAEAKRPDDVIKVYAEAARVFPDEPLVYNNQGMFYQSQKNYPDAVRSFNLAIQKNPQYYIAVTNRGYALLEAGRHKEAETDFAASLRLNPNQPGVRGFMATAQLMQGEWQKALGEYQNVIKQSPGNAFAHADAGFAAFFGKDYDTALSEFNQVITLEPAARFINPWRTWTLVRLGKTPQAAGIAQSSRSRTDPERDWIDWLVLFHVGDITAEDLVAHVDKRDPDVEAAQMCEARFFIAEHLLQSGQTQQAASEYEQALRTNKRQLSAWRGASYALRRFQ